MPNIISQDSSGLPLQLGSPEQFKRIRAALLESGFNSETLCQKLGIPSMSQVGKVRWSEVDSSGWPEPLRRWAGVFLFGERVLQADLVRLAGVEAIDSFIGVGLLRPAKAAQETLVSPVLLYPAAGLLIASDRPEDPDAPSSAPTDVPADVVFPGIYGGTLRFLELLPVFEGGDALDLCGGCGIGALCMARSARAAVSADITARATRFAAFNALLNECRNIEAARGDLYEAVADRQFDVITAHPPYVPSVGNSMIFRDAGDVGEDITRKIVAGLPQHLRPGGKALLLCQGRDADDGSFEERARAWLGEAQVEFDVLFALEVTRTLDQEARGIMRGAQQPGPGELAELIARFQKAGTRRFVYGALAMQRHAGPGVAPWTARLRLSPEARGVDFDRLIVWHHRRERPDFSAWLAQKALRLAPHFEVHVRHVVRDDTLVPAEFVFKVDQPFVSALRIDGWVTPLLAQFNGAKTPAAIHGAAQKHGTTPADFQLPDFLKLLEDLVERGYLEA